MLDSNSSLGAQGDTSVIKDDLVRGVLLEGDQEVVVGSWVVNMGDSVFEGNLSGAGRAADLIIDALNLATGDDKVGPEWENGDVWKDVCAGWEWEGVAAVGVVVDIVTIGEFVEPEELEQQYQYQLRKKLLFMLRRLTPLTLTKIRLDLKL